MNVQIQINPSVARAMSARFGVPFFAVLEYLSEIGIDGGATGTLKEWGKWTKTEKRFVKAFFEHAKKNPPPDRVLRVALEIPLTDETNITCVSDAVLTALKKMRGSRSRAANSYQRKRSGQERSGENSMKGESNCDPFEC